MEITEGTRYGGRFTVDGKARTGEITFQGSSTNLRVQDAVYFQPDAVDDRCIHGVLNDLTRLSLFQCNVPEVSGMAMQHGEVYRFADIFPHYVLHGGRHLKPKDAVIEAITFIVDDAAVIFDDFGAFGHALRPKMHIGAVLRANAKQIGQTDIPATGKYPEIAYFSGNTRIFMADTALGEVTATHNPKTNWGGSEGVFIRNLITVMIRFVAPTVFDSAIEGLLQVKRFLEMMAGRAQNLSSISVTLRESARKKSHLEVYWCSPPTREAGGRGPHPADLPIAAARTPVVFAGVLERWLARDADWRDARQRFSNSFAQRHTYSVDRLIGLANMFDLLPPGAVPKHVALSPELASARDVALAAFKALPDSPQRASVLGALGRLGKSTLRDKILHRARPIVEILGPRGEGLPSVIALAVDCRNHYVHGAEPKVDYTGHFFETVTFLTDTLEFVFGASDLIDAGWDLAGYADKPSSLSHPFAHYLKTYADQLIEMNGVLPERWRITGPAA